MSNKLRYSPCIGLCSTVYGDDVCRGCKRFSEEVIIWNQMEEPLKITALTRIDTITESIMSDYFELLDEALLLEKIEQLDIWLHPHQPPLSKAFTLLLKGRDHLKDWASCGLKLKQHSVLTVHQMIDDIDNQIYTASQQRFEEML